MARPRITLPVKWRQAKSRRCWRRRWRSDAHVSASIANREWLATGSCRAALGLDGRDARPHTILRNIFANIIVARRHELLSVAIEDDFPIAQDQEAHGHF